MSHRSTGVGLVFAGVLVVTSVAPALAEAENVTRLDRAVTQLERNVTPLDRSVSEFVAQTTEGGNSTLTMQSDVLFAFGSAQLAPSAARRIGEEVAGLRQGVDVAVDGHTDDIPFERGNDVLSRERAQAVADAIAAVRPDLALTVTGYGDTRPVAANEKNGEDDPVGRAKNRRVEVRFAG